MGAEFEPGDVTIALLNTGKLGIEFQENKVPIAFQVDDVEAARAELESRGVTFVADTIDSGVCHMAHFTDPDGNVLMLHNRYAPKGAAAGRQQLGRQLHSPRACLACQALVGVAVRGVEAHVLGVPAGGEVALVGGVRVERREQVGRVAERGGPERRHEAEPRARARRARNVEPGRNSPLRRASQRRAEHVGGLLDVRDQDAPRIGLGVEQELERDLVEALGRRRCQLARAGHRPPLRQARVSTAQRSGSRRAAA